MKVSTMFYIADTTFYFVQQNLNIISVNVGSRWSCWLLVAKHAWNKKITRLGWLLILGFCFSTNNPHDHLCKISHCIVGNAQYHLLANITCPYHNKCYMFIAWNALNTCNLFVVHISHNVAQQFHGSTFGLFSGNECY